MSLPLLAALRACTVTTLTLGFAAPASAQPPAGVAAAVEAAITAYLRTLTDSDLA